MCHKKWPLLVVVLAMPDFAAGQENETNQKELAPIQFTQHQEQGEWETFRNDHFTIRLPSAWSVYLRQDTDDDDDLLIHPEWEYMVCDDELEHVFGVHIVEGGPERIPCFCGPREKWEYLEREPYKMWALTFDFGATALALRNRNDDARPAIMRNFKVAHSELRLDIHATVRRRDAEKVYYIVESARPVR